MKFSILSSIYYKENPKHFDECMYSIWQKQTLKASEMILVEDGVLSDELNEKISFWQDKLGDILKVIKLPKNIGTGLAKNIGLQYCTYDIICIVDTDDICVENRFERQMLFFNNHPNVDILGGQIAEFSYNENIIKGVRKVPLFHKNIVQFAKKRNPFNNMTIAYRKQAILNAGGYKHHLWMEDYNLLLRLIFNGATLRNLPDLLVYARVDNGMYDRRRGWQYIESEWQLFQLKRTLNVQNLFSAFIVFILRSVPRLLPAGLLQHMYRYLRNYK